VRTRVRVSAYTRGQHITCHSHWVGT